MILSLDPSKTRLGWAFTCETPGRGCGGCCSRARRSPDGNAICTCDIPGLPIAAGTIRLDIPDAGWLHQQVAAGFHALAARARNIRRDVTAVAIEEPFGPSMERAKEYGAVMALAQREWHGHWGDLPFRVYGPGEWKVAAGLNGRASKEDVARFALHLAVEANWSLDEQAALGQDACDAIVIGRAYSNQLETT